MKYEALKCNYGCESCVNEGSQEQKKYGCDPFQQKMLSKGLPHCSKGYIYKANGSGIQEKKNDDFMGYGVGKYEPIHAPKEGECNGCIASYGDKLCQELKQYQLIKCSEEDIIYQLKNTYLVNLDWVRRQFELTYFTGKLEKDNEGYYMQTLTNNRWEGYQQALIDFGLLEDK